MKIREYIKKVGIACSPGPLKIWQAVNVGFVNSSREDDETQFDVKQACTKAGNEELAQLFESFCKENSFSTDTVTYVGITACADTYKELEVLTV